MTQEVDISKKYANAFLNQYFDELSDELIKQFIKLERFLKKNIVFLLNYRTSSVFQPLLLFGMMANLSL